MANRFIASCAVFVSVGLCGCKSAANAGRGALPAFGPEAVVDTGAVARDILADGTL